MDPITIIIALAVIGVALLILFFLKTKKGKGASTSKEKAKDKGKKKSKKGDKEETTEVAAVENKAAVDLAHVQTQVNIFIQQKDYAKAESLLNASLKDDNTLYPLYANLLNVYHLQDDDFAINQLFSSIEKQGLNEIYQKLNAEHENYQQIKADEKARKALEPEPAPVVEEATEVAQSVDTSAFDDLAQDFTSTKASTATSNTLEFSPSGSNDHHLDFKSDNDKGLDFAKTAAVATAAAASVAVATDSHSLDFDGLKTETDNSLSFDSLQTAPTTTDNSLSFDSLQTAPATTDNSLSFDSLQATTDNSLSFDSLQTTTTDAVVESTSFDSLALDVPEVQVEKAAESTSLQFDSNLATEENNTLSFEPANLSLSTEPSLNVDTTPLTVDNTQDLSLPELNIAETTVAETSLSLGENNQAPLSDSEFSFDLNSVPTTTPASQPDFSFNLENVAETTTTTPSTSFVLDAEPAAPTLGEMNTLDTANTLSLDNSPKMPSLGEMTIDTPVAEVTHPNVEVTPPQVSSHHFEMPSLDPATVSTTTETSSGVEGEGYVDAQDPIVELFPALATTEPTQLDLDLVDQYIKLGQFEAAKSLLAEAKNASNVAEYAQRIADLQEKIA